MKKKNSAFLTVISLLLLLSLQAHAGGISVDAGLTPAQDRYILRLQYRYMTMNNSMMQTNTHMIPLVLAYGITPKLSVMGRGLYTHRTYSNDAPSANGINDFFLLTKYRLFRKNTPTYILGIAPHFATNIPVGSREISPRLWSPEVGLNVSFRPRFWAIDVSTAYQFTDIMGESEQIIANSFHINTAFSALIPMKKNSEMVLSPVLEAGYINERKIRATDLPAKQTVLVSPGLSFIYSSFVLEGLLQIPVYQSQTNGNAMTQNPRLILGMRVMF